MTKKSKNRLGNGLDILFDDNLPETSSDVRDLRISLIEPDKEQPRTEFDEEKLAQLAQSISAHGVLQPILVRPLENGGFRIVAGERRWRAARIAGLTEIPAVSREMTDCEAAQYALIENLQREDLDPIEEAAAYSKLMSDYSMTQEQTAAAVGKSRAAIANSVRLLSLSEPVRELVRNGSLSVGHAKVLCGISDSAKQLALADECVKKSLTVRQLESRLKEKPPEAKTKSKPKFADGFAKLALETESSIKNEFGIGAKLKQDGNAMTLSLKFKNENELKRIMEKLAQ